MAEKLYVYAIATHGPASGMKGYQTITLMRLPAEEALRKADLTAQILHESDDSKRNLLYDQYEAIRGPLEAYVVREGQYQLGQVLDAVPADAVPVDKFFKLG